jgi:hypothetical protein
MTSYKVLSPMGEYNNTMEIHSRQHMQHPVFMDLEHVGQELLEKSGQFIITIGSK